MPRARPPDWCLTRERTSIMASGKHRATDPMRASGGQLYYSPPVPRNLLEDHGCGHVHGSPVANTYPIALDYDSTLVLAIELSNTSWVLAATGSWAAAGQGEANPLSRRLRHCWRPSTATVIEPERPGERSNGWSPPTRPAGPGSGWRAGCSGGGWRRTSSSLPAFRLTGVRDARNLTGSTPELPYCARCWLWLRGEPRVCSMVPIPDETDEDERRRVREQGRTCWPSE